MYTSLEVKVMRITKESWYRVVDFDKEIYCVRKWVKESRCNVYTRYARLNSFLFVIDWYVRYSDRQERNSFY